MTVRKDIPKDWKRVKLGNILSVSSGKGIKVNELKGGAYSVYGGNGLNGYHSEYLNEEPKLIIGRVGVKCGVTHITKPKSWVTDNALIVERKNDAFDLKFMQLKLQFENLNKLSVSTAQPVISGSKIYAYEILLPPKPDQQQIVSKIEELFSELDKGIEELKTAQQQLKVYRQAVLKWAFEGKLTNEDVKEGELPEGWKVESLSQVSKVSGGISKTPKRLGLPISRPFLRVANVYLNKLDLSEMHTIGLAESELERVTLIKNDLLFVEGNGSIEQIGRVALWNGMVEDCVHQNHLIKSRLSKKVLPKYALYFFCSKTGRDNIKRQANSTSGLHTLNINKISNLELPICSLEEQQQIVQEIESRLSVCDKIEETITNSLKQSEALRQSILKKAFEGKLI